MKFLIAFLICFNVHAACDQTTIEGIENCTMDDAVGDLVSEITPGAAWSMQGTGTFEERFKGNKVVLRQIKNGLIRWKGKKLKNKIDCQKIVGAENKRMCKAWKAMFK